MFMPTQIDGQEALNVGESAAYLRISPITLRRKIEEYNEAHPNDKIETLYNNLRSQARYYRKSDLDKLSGFRSIE